ncbi:MAG: serine/threonine protein kinase [Thiotrichales bacterium]|nr:serine/threonine protein kinase [Thiotrichales bacterium]
MINEPGADPSRPVPGSDPGTASDLFHRLGPNQIMAILEQAGLQPDGHILALNSYENRVYRIGLEDAEPMVVKFYRPGRWTDAAILEEHRFTAELAEAEIPVVPPIAHGNADTLLHQDGHRFSLYPCVGGRPPELDNPEQLRQMGTFIARLHNVGAGPGFQHRPDIDPPSYLHEPGAYLLQQSLLPAELETAFQTLIEDLYRRVDRCYEQAGSSAQLRLHGDCHQGNILWRDDVPSILDFDDARTGPAMQDIWMFLSGDREYMTRRLDDFLQGYRMFREFNPAELHLLEALRCMRMIHHAAWLARRWNDPAFPIAFPYFNSQRYWEELILGLREQAALMDEPPLQISY